MSARTKQARVAGLLALTSALAPVWHITPVTTSTAATGGTTMLRGPMTERHITFIPPPGVIFHGNHDGKVYVSIEVKDGASWAERMETRMVGCDTANRLRLAVDASCDEELELEMNEIGVSDE